MLARILFVQFAICVLLSIEGLRAAEEPTDADFDPVQLRPLFADDFSEDTRDQYEIKGDVQWEPGCFTLKEGAAIFRRLDAGSWTQIHSDLHFPRDKSKSFETTLRVGMNGATDFLVVWNRRVTGGKVRNELSVLDTDPDSAPGQQLELKGRWTFDEFAAGTWRITYRYGAVVITPPMRVDASDAYAFLKNGTATVESLTWQQRLASVAFDSIAVSGSVKPQPLDDEQEAIAKEAAILNHQAAMLYRKGKFPEAIEHARRSVKLRRQVLGNQHPDYATSLNNLALLYKSTGKLTEAEQLDREALSIRKKILGDTHRDYANSLNNLASIYFSQGKFQQAVQFFGQAQELAKKTVGQEHPNYALTLNNLAEVHRSMGRYAEAEPLYRQAMGIIRSTVSEEHPHYMLSLGNLASLYAAVGELAEAERLYKRVIRIQKKVLGEEHPRYAVNVNRLAGLYRDLGDYVLADSLYRQALRIRERVLGKTHPAYANSVNNLGSLNSSIGDYAQAEPLLREALEIHRKAYGEEHPNYATSLTNLGLLYCRMQDLERAEPLIRQGLAIRKKVLGDEHSEYATSLNILGVLYRKMGDYGQAEKLYRQSLDINRRVFGEQHTAYTRSLGNLVGLLSAIGEYSEANRLAEQDLDLRGRLLSKKHGDYAESLRKLANLQRLLGNFKRAEELFAESLDIEFDAAAQTLSAFPESQSLRWMNEHPPRYDLLLSNLRDTEGSTIDPYWAVWRTKSLATRMQLNRRLAPNASPQARRVFAHLRDARLKLARLIAATPDPSRTGQFEQQIATANEDKERLEKELASINPATKRVLAVQDAKIEDLLTLLPTGVAVVDFLWSPDWRRVTKEITITKHDGSQELRSITDLEPISVYDAFVLRADREQAIWVQLRDAEPIDAAAKSWVDQIYTPAKRDLDKHAASPSESHVDANPAKVLRQRVWEKIEPHLSECHTVIVLPDGDLNRIPWAALPGRKDDRFLIEEYSLCTAAYGQQLFGLLSDAPLQGDRLVLSGAINYDDRPVGDQPPPNESVKVRRSLANHKAQEWRFLAGTRLESQKIRQLWNDHGRLTQLTGTEATEAKLAQALPHSRYAHIATHGFFASQDSVGLFSRNHHEQSLFVTTAPHSAAATVAGRNPLLLSGLVVAGANHLPERDELGAPVTEDGILTAEEIVGLDLRNTELVTLSACETGVGDIDAAEGVFGLQRAFQQAGARAVIASLWKVDDIATQALMVEFYKNLWQKKMGKLAALRAAQLKMIGSYDPKSGEVRGLGGKSVKLKQGDTKPQRLPPFYWAAFQLSGDWR